MADDIFNVQPPAWLTHIAQPADMSIASKVVGEVIGGLANTVEDSVKSAQQKRDNGDLTASWIKEFPSNIKTGLIQARLNMADPLGQIKAQQAGLNVGRSFLGLQEQQIGIDQQKNDLSMQQHDQTELAGWLKKYPTWEGRQTAPAPTLFTPQFQKSWDGIMLQDTKTIQARAVTSSIRDFAKTVDEARRLGIDVGRYAQYIGRPVPTEIQQQLDKEMADKKAEATPKPSAAIQDVNQISEWEKQAREADARGDTAAAKELRDKATMLREQMKGENVVMGYDDQGRAIFAMGKGAQLPTVATQSMAQGKLLQYENATELMNYLEQNMTEEHVGLAGASGEFIFDKTLAQFFPGSANKDRIKVRTTLTGLREGLLREMADDRSGRFTRADRDEIEKALPSSGVFESKEDAMQRIARVREILANRGKVYARSLGVKPPTWTLSVDEIKKMYQDGLASKLDPNTKEFKQKYLTKEEAVDALTRFH